MMPGHAEVTHCASVSNTLYRQGSAPGRHSKPQPEVKMNFSVTAASLMLQAPAGASLNRGNYADFNQVGPRPLERLVTDVVEVAEGIRRHLRKLPIDLGSTPASERQAKGLLAELQDDLIVLLARSGIEREDPTGSTFDPTTQQLVAEQQSSSHLPGTVIETVACTWWLNGLLLRPGMVFVAKAAAVVA